MSMKTMSMKSTKSVLRGEEGSLAIWVAGSMTMLLGFAALAIDASHFYAVENELQTAADAAALAAVSQLPDAAEARSVAAAITAQNLPAAVHGTALTNADVELGQWDPDTRVFTAGLNPADAIRVTVLRTAARGNAAQTIFGKVLGYNSMDIGAQAIAAPPRAPTCLLALEPVAKEAIMLNSGSSISANGCALQVNSASAEAVMTNSGSALTAEQTNISGDYSGGGYTPTPTTGVPQVSDPLAGLPPPPEAGDPCDHTDLGYDAETVTLSPGVYCQNLTLNSFTDATMLPGTYVFRDGDFIVNSNSTVTGTGVFLYFTGNDTPEFILNSDSHADLSAPTTGTYAGILIYQDRNVEDGTELLFNSDASSVFIGTIYVPNAKIMINSGTTLSGTSPYTSFIARTFEINANSGIVLNSDYAATDVPVPPGMAGSNTALVQ